MKGAAFPFVHTIRGVDSELSGRAPAHRMNRARECISEFIPRLGAAHQAAARQPVNVCRRTPQGADLTSLRASLGLVDRLVQEPRWVRQISSLDERPPLQVLRWAAASRRVGADNRADCRRPRLSLSIWSTQPSLIRCDAAMLQRPSLVTAEQDGAQAPSTWQPKY